MAPEAPKKRILPPPLPALRYPPELPIVGRRRDIVAAIRDNPLVQEIYLGGAE